MEISKKDMKILLKAQQGELGAVLMYNALAEVGFCIPQSHKANMLP